MNLSDAVDSLGLITEAAASREAHIAEFDDDRLTTESDDEENSESPIMDQFYEERGQEAIHQMTKFTRHEFDMLYGVIDERSEQVWNSGPGKKSAYT